MPEQPFGVLYAVDIDILVERVAFLRVDAVGNIGAVGTQHSCYVSHLQVAVEERFLLVHQLVEALHQFGGRC